MSKRYLIIGAGFSGTVLADQLVKHSDCTIDIWDERDHLGGNCHTSRDAKTGIMVHQYGPHIFNTDKKEIWDYVNSLGEFRPYVHRVKAMSKGKVYSLPVNLHTINQFFDKSFNPEEAKEFITSQADKTIDEPKSFEEQALKFIGKDLYKAFFYGYTKKQWGCEPSALPASILKRLPVRFNYDDNYYNNPYQGIPVNGYTDLVEKLLQHTNITVQLNKKFVFDAGLFNQYDHIFYSLIRLLMCRRQDFHIYRAQHIQRCHIFLLYFLNQKLFAFFILYAFKAYSFIFFIIPITPLCLFGVITSLSPRSFTISISTFFSSSIVEFEKISKII